MESVRRAVEAAAVEDQTSGYVEKLVYPKFEVCQTDRGEYRFRLKAGNGEIVAASDIYAPVDGEVLDGNPVVADDASRISADPEGEGWIFRFRLSAPEQLSGLMDAAAYEAFLG